MIGLVDYDQATRRFHQRAQVIIAQHATGGIIWRADYRNFRLQAADCILQRLNIEPKLAAKRNADNVASKHRSDLPVQSERRLVDEHMCSLSDGDHQEGLG